MLLVSISFLLSILSSLAGRPLCVDGLAVPPSHALHEKRDVRAHAALWVRRRRVPARAVLPMRIGLRQENLERGDGFLMDVSDPASPNYGKHWTADEVVEMFAPSQDSVASVRDWLVRAGIDENRITHTDNRGWLAFEATTDEAGRLMHAEFHEYEHMATGHITAACDSYHVPKHIQHHIDYITPGIKLLAPQSSRLPRRKRHDPDPTRHNKFRPHPHHHHHWPNTTTPNATAPTTSCDTVVTAACIRALYNVTLGTHAHHSNAIGIFEEGSSYAQADLDLFYASLSAPRIPPGTHPAIARIDGAVAPAPSLADAGSESNLDFMVAYPLVWPQSAVLFQTDDAQYASGATYFAGGFNSFLDAIDGSYCTYCAFGQCGDDANDPVYPDPAAGGYKGKAMCGVFEPTNVISISYGGQESGVPEYYQKRQCNEFMKLGLRGISVFISSGDSGVSGPGGCLGQLQSVFSPTWPNSCPYVTNVGATKINPGCTVLDSESAAVDPRGHPWNHDFYSGGGFSNIYSIPSYQAAAINHYFTAHNPPYQYYNSSSENFDFTSGRYNRSGRGIPDVAANGDNIAIYLHGTSGLQGGTSASAPIFAAIVNRINEERLAIGKRTVGFINPALYAHPEVLNDVTNGTNPGCGTNGFAAVEGWDPVTGLGTPNYPKMLKLFLKLP